MDRSMDASGTGSAYSSNGSFESSLVRYPCRTVCNLFWGNRLASRPFTCGDTPISFPSLWPDVAVFTSLYREGGLAAALPDIVRLLLATGGYPQLDGLQKSGQLSWEHELEQDKCTLIHMVCALNCEPLLEAALKQVPQNGLLTIKDAQGHTPAEVCFTPGMRKLVKKPFWRTAKTIPTGQQLTSEVKRELFNMASTPAGLYQLALILQTHSVNVDELKNEEGNHLLHVAVSGGMACLPNVFLLVSQYKASIHQTNAHGVSPLSLACQLGEEKVAEVLLCVMGASANAVNPVNGWTSLHYSAHYNKPELIRMLLTRGANSCAEDNAKRDPSFLAQQSGATECNQILAMDSRERANNLAKLALEGSLVVDNLYPSDLYNVSEDGCTLLMKAVLGNHPSIVRALVNNNQCPINFKQMRLPDLSDIEGSLSSVPSVVDQPLKTAVTLAAANGFNDCLQILLNAGAHPAIEDAQHWLPLHYACHGGHYKCVKTILDHPQGKGLTRLSLAKSLAQDKNNTDIVTILNQARTKRQKQIVSDRLFEIASSGDHHELYVLLEDGDDVNPKNETSDWPILIAAGFGHLEIIKMLHKQGGNVAISHQYNMNTPLHTSARGGHLDVVRYLLKEFCSRVNVTVAPPNMVNQRLLNINDKNSSGATPLELAAQHGHMAVVRLLLDHGAVTTLPDSNNQLLSCKMFCGIQFLLEERRREQLDRLTRALVDQRPVKEFSKLWQGPSDFNQRDVHWNTVLMIAARHAKSDVLEYLLQSAAHYTRDMTINWASSPQDEPEAGSPEPAAAEPVYMKRRRYSERMRDTRAQSVGPAAMKKYGYYGAMESEDERFVSVSGDHTHYAAAAATPTDKEPEGTCTPSGIVCLVNRNGYTALHCAVEGRNYKIIRLLLQADPLVANMQDKNGQTALHLACRLNFKNCIKALLECPSVVIDSEVKDNASNLAEELCVNGRLKKRVTEYRIKQIRRGHPARRPLPPTPPHPHNPTHYEDIGRYSRVVVDHRGHRRCESDIDGRISDWPEPEPHYSHTHHAGRRQRRRAHSPPLSSDENYSSTAAARRRRHASPMHDPTSPSHRHNLSPIRDSASPPSRSPRRAAQPLDTLPESAANLRQNIHFAQTSDTDS